MYEYFVEKTTKSIDVLFKVKLFLMFCLLAMIAVLLKTLPCTIYEHVFRPLRTLSHYPSPSFSLFSSMFPWERSPSGRYWLFSLPWALSWSSIPQGANRTVPILAESFFLLHPFLVCLPAKFLCYSLCLHIYSYSSHLIRDFWNGISRTHLLYYTPAYLRISLSCNFRIFTN